jgi:tetratricopeptide (TPR) repeat protein
VLLGACLSVDGEVEVAARWIVEGKAHFERSQEHVGIAWAMSMLGNLFLDNKLPHVAQPIYEEELQIVLEHGSHRAIYTFDNLAKAAIAQDNFQEAVDYLEQAAAIASTLDDERCNTMIETTRGEVAAERGHFHEAREYALRTLKRLERLDSPYETTYVFRILATALIGLGQFREGAHLLGATSGIQARLEIDIGQDEERRSEVQSAKARASLSAEDFERAWREGYELELGEAYAVALVRASAPPVL